MKPAYHSESPTETPPPAEQLALSADVVGRDG